jgi:hypothetical protein
MRWRRISGGVLEEVGGEGVLVEEDGAALKSQVGFSVGSFGEVRLFDGDLVGVFLHLAPDGGARNYEEALDALVLPGFEGFEGAAGGAGLGVREVFELVFEGGPEVGLPHEEDGEDLVVVEGLGPEGGGLCGGLLGGEASVGIDGDVDGVGVFEAPGIAGDAEMGCHERSYVRGLGAEVAGVAEDSVVLHVDDEGIHLAVAEGLVGGELDLFLRGEA